MTKVTTGAGIALLAAFLFFAAPSDGQAQGYRSGGHAPGSSAYGGYGSGYGSYGTSGGYGRGGYGSGYSGYGSGGYGYGRPTVVHPETLHWTPYRGLHSHGHMHVPHRGHSHVRPY